MSDHERPELRELTSEEHDRLGEVSNYIYGRTVRQPENWMRVRGGGQWPLMIDLSSAVGYSSISRITVDLLRALITPERMAYTGDWDYRSHTLTFSRASVLHLVAELQLELQLGDHDLTLIIVAPLTSMRGSHSQVRWEFHSMSVTMGARTPPRPNPLGQVSSNVMGVISTPGLLDVSALARGTMTRPIITSGQSFSDWYYAVRGWKRRKRNGCGVLGCSEARIPGTVRCLSHVRNTEIGCLIHSCTHPAQEMFCSSHDEQWSAWIQANSYTGVSLIAFAANLALKRLGVPMLIGEHGLPEGVAGDWVEGEL